MDINKTVMRIKTALEDLESSGFFNLEPPKLRNREPLKAVIVISDSLKIHVSRVCIHNKNMIVEVRNILSGFNSPFVIQDSSNSEVESRVCKALESLHKLGNGFKLNRNKQEVD